MSYMSHLLNNYSNLNFFPSLKLWKNDEELINEEFKESILEHSKGGKLEYDIFFNKVASTKPLKHTIKGKDSKQTEVEADEYKAEVKKAEVKILEVFTSKEVELKDSKKRNSK